MLVVLKYLPTFALQLRGNMSLMIIAQMAESVDALVSNTSGVTSIPVRPRVWVPGKELSRMSNQMLGSFLFLVASLQFHLFLYLSGETPVILTKNLPKTDWSEKPRLSAISFIPISVLSSKRFASAQSSSDT